MHTIIGTGFGKRKITKIPDDDEEPVLYADTLDKKIEKIPSEIR